jgi:hypothetical protein
MGDQGNSWTVPVFVLNSVQNDVMAGDEDPIPGNGNPHPEHPQQNAANGNGIQFPGIFEAVQDLDEVHHENVNQGWELPPPPPPQVNLEGWAQWPEPQFEEIDENEVNLVNNLVDAAVANAAANGVMQHPEVPQDSNSVSSDVQAFFRAQGAPVTLELSLPNDASASRIVLVAGGNDIAFEDGNAIRQLAARFGIHQCYGPSPSVEMLVQDLAAYAQSLLALMPMKEPLPAQSWNFVPATSFANTWFFCVDNPAWGNNAEASSSSGARRPRLELIRTTHSDCVPNQLNLEASLEHNNNHVPLSQISPDQEASNSSVVDMELDSPTRFVSEVNSNLAAAKKRRGRHHTPIVDDEVRRSAKLINETLHDHIQLDGEPRRRKGATKKSVSFSSVTDLKKAIVSSSLDEDLTEFEVAPIQASTLADLCTSFCGVPPSELSLATLLHEVEDQ